MKTLGIAVRLLLYDAAVFFRINVDVSLFIGHQNLEEIKKTN